MFGKREKMTTKGKSGRSRRLIRSLGAVLLALGLVLPQLGTGSQLAFADEQSATPRPTLHLVVEGHEGPPPLVEVGQEFCLLLLLGHEPDQPALSGLTRLIGQLAFEPGQVELLSLELGEVLAGWTLTQSQSQPGRVDIDLQGPPVGGEAVLLRANFRAAAGAAGPAIVALMGGEFDPDLNAFTGYLYVDEQSVPVAVVGPPALGISTAVEVRPTELRIAVANPFRQALSVYLDASTQSVLEASVGPVVLSGALSLDEGLTWADLDQLGVFRAWRGRDVFLQFPHGTFVIGDSLRLQLTATGGADGQTALFTDVETPAFEVPARLGSPLDLGEMSAHFTLVGARLEHNGEELAAYNADQRPTVAFDIEPWGPVAKRLTVLWHGHPYYTAFAGPFEQLPEVPVTEDWPTGEYILVLAVGYIFDPTGTTVGIAALPCTVDRDINRADAAQLVAEALCLPMDWPEFTPTEPTYSDVPPDHWAFRSIEALTKLGIVQGRPDGTFGPEDPIDRAAYAVLVTRAFGVAQYTPGTPTYSDVPSDHWAFGHIEALSRLGVIQGFPDGSFRPHETVTDLAAVGVLRAFRETVISLSGRVTDSSGNPLEDIWVTASHHPGGWWVGATTTDTAGDYSLTGLASGTYIIEVHGAGWARAWYPDARDPHSAQAVSVEVPVVTTAIDFQLWPGGSISGRITSPSGEGLPGVSIDVWEVDGGAGGATLSDQDGYYRIEGLPFGAYRVVAPSYGRWGPGDGSWVRSEYPTAVVIDTQQRDVGGVDLQLTTGGSISGQVTGEGGQPLAGAHVNVHGYENNEWMGWAETDTGGHYTIAGLPEGDYRVDAHAEGYAHQWYNGRPYHHEADRVTVTDGAAVGDVNFQLQPGGSISGRITGPSGEGLLGVSIDAWEVDGGAGGATLSDQDGYYRIEGLPFGAYRVRAPAHGRWGPGDGPWVWSEYPTAVIIDTQQRDVGGVDLQLTTGGSISGQVTGEGGQPLVGAHVNVHRYEDNEWMGWAEADTGGHYTIAGLPEGDYRVDAHAEGHARQWYNGQLFHHEADRVTVTDGAAVGDVNFQLQPGGSISGRITGPTGQGLAGVSVEAWSEAGLGGGGTETDGGGYYRIEGLPFGSYRVRAPAHGRWGSGDGPWVRSEYPTEVVIDTQQRDVGGVDLQLTTGGSISGQVTGEGGQPLAGAHVNVHGYEDNKWMGRAEADTDGHYTIAGLPEGDYRVDAHAEGYAHQWYNGRLFHHEADRVTVTDGAAVGDVNFQLQPGGSISGRITDPTGQGLAGVSVEAWSEAGLGGGGTETDGGGYYRIEGLPFGAYRVVAPSYGRWGPGDGPWVRSEYPTEVVIDTQQRDVGGVDLQLTTGGSISGQVTGEGGQPLAGAHVNVHGYEDNEWMGWAETDTGGHYTIAGLPEGDYRVDAHAEGYAHQWYNGRPYHHEADRVTVTGGAAVGDVNFQLQPGGSISGRITGATGQGLAGVSVEAWSEAGRGGGGAETDSGGYYRIEGLPIDTYTVQAPSGGRWGPGDGEWIRAYQPHVVLTETLRDAQGIDLQLLPGGSITGTVIDRYSLLPVAGVHVHAEEYASGEWLGGADSQPDGSFAIRGLPGGTYRLRANAQPEQGYLSIWYTSDGGTYLWDQSAAVSLAGAGHTATADFTLDPMFQRPSIDESIGDGVAWLVGQQNSDGSWGGGYRLAKTGLALTILGAHAGREGLTPFDPAYLYREQAEAGFAYLLNYAYSVELSPQFHLGRVSDPDSNGNGRGLYFSQETVKTRVIYETSIAMMAIAASASPDRIIDAGGSAVHGLSFREVLHDAVDCIAWAQTDRGWGRGGWNYTPMDNAGDRSDQSNSGWVTLALAYAEMQPFGISPPDFVRAELDLWLDYIQYLGEDEFHHGGSEYTGPGEPSPELWTNLLRTGNLLQQLALVGEGLSGPRVQAAIGYVVRHWDTQHQDVGWRDALSWYHTTYTLMKGLEAVELEIVSDGQRAIDWFAELSAAITMEQSGPGWWAPCPFDDGERILSTQWALLTLMRTTPETREGADLAVVDLVVGGDDAELSLSEVHYHVANRGNAAAGSGQLHLWVGEVLAASIQVAGLNPGEEFTGTFTFDPHLQLTEPTCLRAQVELDGGAPELTLANNTMLVVWPNLVVQFADARLEEAVRTWLGLPGPVTLTDLAGLTALDASGQGIEDLTGLEHARNLAWLGLRSNRLSGISPLVALQEKGGLAPGSFVDIRFNGLDLSPGSTTLEHIQALVAGGVEVVYTPQLLAFGDFDGDGQITAIDMHILLYHYGLPRGAPGWHDELDLDGDGVVGLRDLVTLARRLTR